MARGPKKHLKRLAAPKHWMLDKMGGTWAPKPSSGPHKMRECLPLVVMLRNRLKYALTNREVKMICMERLVKVDGKVRNDPKYPAGFMDVVTMEASGDAFRLMFNVKGRFVLHRINKEETNYKLCRVQKVAVTHNKTPYVVTHDARTIRYPDPLIKVNDTVRVDLTTGKIMDFIKFETGKLVMITKGNNAGRVGVMTSRDRHPGSFDIVHMTDSVGNSFATRLANVFVIGNDAHEPMVSLPKGKGIQLTIMEERSRAAQKASQRK